MAAKLVRGGVLIVGWAAVTKEYFFDIKYGMGVSMAPTIPDGSFIFVEHLSRRWRNWERGELVELRSPSRHMRETIVKRILALTDRHWWLQEGDVVELQPRFDENRKDKITVPKGHVWVEGDNATCSVDSRFFGPVPIALLTGRPFWIVSACVSSCLWHDLTLVVAVRRSNAENHAGRRCSQSRQELDHHYRHNAIHHKFVFLRGFRPHVDALSSASIFDHYGVIAALLFSLSSIIWLVLIVSCAFRSLCATVGTKVGLLRWIRGMALRAIIWPLRFARCSSICSLCRSFFFSLFGLIDGVIVVHPLEFLPAVRQQHPHAIRVLSIHLVAKLHLHIRLHHLALFPLRTAARRAQTLRV
ncbi:AP-1 complex subunit mu-1 [Phytophthora nicotianae]|uniref:Mitochondrial inner membrane protease subunit n=1 Tax=Phytophthora nicotianae TaxID=4792 RepID=A0A0W8DUW1_PHYNI|nr:AP-1 complex subunit mu-1 [Phytophthora nicotianae]